MRRRTPWRKVLPIALPLGVFYLSRLFTGDAPLWIPFSVLAGAVVVSLATVTLTYLMRRRQRLIFKNGRLTSRGLLRDRCIDKCDVSHAIRVNVAYPNPQTGALAEQHSTFLIGQDGSPLLRLREHTWPNATLESLLAHMQVPLNALPDPLEPSEAEWVIGGGFPRYETRPVSTAILGAGIVLALTVLVIVVLTWLGFL